MVNCIKYNVSLEKKSRSSYTLISQNSVYCKRCYKKCNKENTATSATALTNSGSVPLSNPTNDDSSTSDTQSSISVTISRSHLNHSQCIFQCKKSQLLRLLSKEECLNIYIKTIFVKYGARICRSHGKNDSLNIPDDFHPHSNSVSLTSSEVYDLLETFKTIYTKNTIPSKISFLDMKIDLLLFETGLNIMQFKEVLSFIEPYELAVKDKELAIGIYLSRLRRGYTFEEMAIRWNVDKNTSSKYCKILRVLEKTLVKKYLSFPRNRDEALNHLTETSKIFYSPTGDKIIIIFGWNVFIYTKRCRLFFPTEHILFT